MLSLRRVRKPARPQRSVTKRATLQVEALESRLVPYSVSGNAWPHPNLITISFVPDGTNVGGVSSNLFATFNNKFGSASTWQNQILKAAQLWAQQTNINFAVVSDNGAGEGSGNYQQGDPGMGDIRIGGYNFGNSALAQAFLPPSANNYSLAGDIQFNTSQTFNIGQTYDLLTVAAHEFGHALGLYESNVISAEMYSAYGGAKSTLTSDDITGVQAIYGGARSPDPYNSYGSNNNSFATAVNLTSQINSTSLTAQVSDLDITTAGNPEFYTFTAPTGTETAFTVQIQSKVLSLLAPKVTIYGADQKTVVGYASGLNKYGTTLLVTVKNVTAGEQFYVDVTGADSSANGTGAYALTLNFGSGSSPTVQLPNTQTRNGTPLSGGGGQAVQQNQEYRVNSTTSGIQQTFWQSSKAVAMDANGNYVVTWSSYGQDGSGWGVYAQRYNASGAPVGSEFRVNSTTSGDQEYSTVAMNASGNFVITWSSYGQDGSGWGVYAQRYNANGHTVGGEFRVNTTTAGDQMYSNVAMDALGDFIITWSSYGQDGSGWGVYAREYTILGLSLGEFRVNSMTAGDQMYSSVAMDTLGDFVITWSSNGQDGSGWGVYAQHYLLGGIPLGGEFRVNTTTAGDQIASSVAMDALGNFTIVWQGQNQDGSGSGICGQQYSLLGLPLGSEFRISSTTVSDHEYPSIAMDAGGNFVVTWSSYGQDGDGWGVYGQQYLSSAAPVGNEFQINGTTQGDQRYSSAALNSNGNLVVVWSGNGVGDSDGVFAQNFQTTNILPGGLFEVGAGDRDDLTNDHSEGGSTSDSQGTTAAQSDAGLSPGTPAVQLASTTILNQPAGLGQFSGTSPTAFQNSIGLFNSVSSSALPQSFLPTPAAGVARDGLPVSSVMLTLLTPGFQPATRSESGTMEGGQRISDLVQPDELSAPLPEVSQDLDIVSMPTQSEAVSWSQACDACFSQAGSTLLAESAETGLAIRDQRNEDGFHALAAAVLGLAVYGHSWPMPRERTTRRRQIA